MSKARSFSNLANAFTITNNDFVFSVDIVPSNNAQQTLGTQTNNFSTVYADVFTGVANTAKYADLAENYKADKFYDPGHVLIFGGEEEVTETNQIGSHKVAGVVSTNPAYLMNAELDGEHIVSLALLGRVPCKVIGSVEKGDLITTSSVAGHGIVNNSAKTGTIIGKSLTKKANSGLGIIEIVVGRM